MSNPFSAQFQSHCQSCGEDMLEGDDVYVVDDAFVCKDCAEANGNVCECGNFKKEEFEECYSCHAEMIDDNDKNYE